MSDAMQQVHADAPVMKAWEAHKATDAYANSLKWATHPEATEGSLWALFYAGFFACAVQSSARIAELEHQLSAAREDRAEGARLVREMRPFRGFMGPMQKKEFLAALAWATGETAK